MQECCVGCFPCDLLPLPQKIPIGFVANTDPRDEPGTHWVAIWIGGDGCGVYFDSYGQQPAQPFKRYLDKFASNGWSCELNAPIQGYLSAVCGQYCVHFLYNKCRGYSVTFSDNPIMNDAVVNEFVFSKFSFDMLTYDVNFVLSQICKEFLK